MKNINEMTDKDIMSNAIRFALPRTSIKEGQDELDRPDFHKVRNTFITCVKWLRDNYKDADPDLGKFYEIIP